MQDIKVVKAMAPARTMEEAVANRQKELEFIEHCISNRMTYEEIGKIMGCCKARVYQILRYGAEFMTTETKRQVKKRDSHKCRICMRDDVRLHLHHINNPKDHSSENLMTLCVRCHMKVEAISNKVRSYPQVGDIGALRK